MCDWEVIFLAPCTVFANASQVGKHPSSLKSFIYLSTAEFKTGHSTIICECISLN